MTFKQKVVLITGASRGIGCGLALAFGNEKAKVVVNYLTSKKEALEIVKKILGVGGEAIPIKTDISKKKDIEKMVKLVMKKFGRIDILINNAGVSLQPSSWQEISEKNWEKIFKVDLKSVFECSRAVGQIMLKQKYGKIINISSLRGYLGGPEVVAYAAAKAGVDNLTKSFAKALAPYINVNGISLGLMNIGMSRFSSEKQKRDWANKALIRKVGKIEDVINVIKFLADDSSSFITGQTIIVDGGFSLK
jgi:3-oxoacyl-[acyl-carrier protein] reductase